MSKEIKDYLPLYVGCCCKVNEFDDEVLLLTGVTYSSITNIYGAYFESIENGYYSLASEVKPILRKLSSMTEEEVQECGNLIYDFSDDNSGLGLNEHKWEDFRYLLMSEQFHWLLKKHFDLFDLIDDGLAIDKETLNQ